VTTTIVLDNDRNAAVSTNECCFSDPRFVAALAASLATCRPRQIVITVEAT
jgi:hypothetical protein